MKLIAVESAAPERKLEAVPVLSLELAHLYRSKIVDKCAEAERNVLRLLRAGGSRLSATAPLSQKLADLKGLLAQGRPTGRTAPIQDLLKRLEPLSRLRTELAHSTMSLAEMEGRNVAVLRNASQPERAEGMRTILTLGGLESRHEELCRVANSLGQAADRVEGLDSMVGLRRPPDGAMGAPPLRGNDGRVA